MSLVIGVDVGTSGCKVSVLDSEQHVVAEAGANYPSHHDHPGWVEQDPEDWVDAVRRALRQAVGGLDAAARAEVRAIAFSGATHVAVLQGGDGVPVRRAIMWNDTRSQPQAAALADRADWIQSITGNRPSTSWTLCHLLWLHERGLLDGVAQGTFMKDWVRRAFVAGGDAVTDWVEAQGALLFDVTTRGWSEQITAATGLPDIAWPQVVDPLSIAGTIDRGVADELGLSHDVPIVVGSTDTATELLAAGSTEIGTSTLKLATAGNVALVQDRMPDDARILVYEHLVPDVYYWNSATSAAATSVSWAAANLLQIPDGPDRYPTYDRMVGASAPGADGLLFVPHLAGERSPLFDPGRRGVLSGFTLRHTAADIARAVMEGVAYGLRSAADLYPALPDAITLIGGGARSAAWPQIIADVFDRPVHVARWGESSIGTAMLAGAAAGLWSVGEVAAEARGKVLDVIEPGRSRAETYREGLERYHAVVEAAAAEAFRSPSTAHQE